MDILYRLPLRLVLSHQVRRLAESSVGRLADQLEVDVADVNMVGTHGVNVDGDADAVGVEAGVEFNGKIMPCLNFEVLL